MGKHMSALSQRQKPSRPRAFMLPLTTYDFRRAATCSRILSSPFAYPTFEAWGEAGFSALQQAVGADHATLTVCRQQNMEAFTSAIRREALGPYFLSVLPANERRWGMQSKQISLGAWSRATIWGDRLREMYRSAYWHELIVPNRAFDTIGLSAGSFQGSVAHFQLYHDRPCGPRFGESALSILQTLYGSFASGVRMWVALHEHLRELSSFTDMLPVAIAFATEAGKILHMNTALRSLVGGVSDSTHLIDEMSRFARQAAEAWNGRWQTFAVNQANLSRAVHTPNAGNYRLSVSSLDGSLIGAPRTLAILVERTDLAPFPSAALKELYSLTDREIEVARLLVEGRSNAEISRALGVSTHTARHHTENVMMKLHVHSRAQIALVVEGARQRPCHPHERRPS